jgi:glycosyltransferase involved in cell wall biosynthesis
MSETLNLSVILPIKSAKVKDFEELYDKAISSLKSQKTPFNELIIVHTDEDRLQEVVNSYDYGDLNVKKLVWSETPNYTSQINYGVENSNSEWVSFFEFDDEYSSIWFKNVAIYAMLTHFYQSSLILMTKVLLQVLQTKQPLRQTSHLIWEF